MVWVHPCQKLEQQQKPSPSHASHARPLLQTARGRRIFKLLNIHWVWPPPSKSFKVKVNRTPQGYECNSPDSHWHPGGDHTQYIYIYTRVPHTCGTSLSFFVGPKRSSYPRKARVVKGFQEYIQWISVVFLSGILLIVFNSFEVGE